MFDFKFLLSSGSVNRRSRIKQACGEHIHKNVNTPHPTLIPTPSQRSKCFVRMYIWTLVHPTPPQSPPQENVLFAQKKLKNTQVPPDLQS